MKNFDIQVEWFKYVIDVELDCQYVSSGQLNNSV